MKRFTGWQWLLIDAANSFGHDKLTFEDRIQWATDNLQDLEALADQAETQPLYRKAVMAIRKAQQGIPTGHMVGVDATCSGIQIMSVLTGCVAGATATGLVNPDERADAYSLATQEMNKILAAEGLSVDISRKDAKQAIMTSFYGSKEQPKLIFGEDTPQLEAFYQAANNIAPGPWELLQDLLQSWQPYALVHEWKLPDGFDARIKVMRKQEKRIEVDELDHTTFAYEFYDNQGTKQGKSNAANVTHSMDGYVLREMHRRCNYDLEVFKTAFGNVLDELVERATGMALVPQQPIPAKVEYYVQQYRRSTLASAVILPHLVERDSVRHLCDEHLAKLEAILKGMNQYQPFPLVTVHDEFKAHPNNVNWVRWNYREILAEIADSNVLDDILGQIHGYAGSFSKLSFNLADLIRQSNYALS
jgi:hypothetical protein